MFLTPSLGFARVNILGDMLFDEARSSVAGSEDLVGHCVAMLTTAAKVA